MFSASQSHNTRIHQKDRLGYSSQDTEPVDAGGASRGQRDPGSHTGRSTQGVSYSRAGLAAPIGETPAGPLALQTTPQITRSDERDGPLGGAGYV